MQTDDTRQDETREILISLVRKVEALQTAIDRLAPSPVAENIQLFGRFNPRDVIQMSDPRLWTGPGAPFVSAKAARDAKTKGCPFYTRGNIRRYAIVAQDLYNWLTNKSKKKLYSA